MNPQAEDGLTRTLARELGAACAWVIPATWHDIVEGLGLPPATTAVVEPLGGCPVACQDLKAMAKRVRDEEKVLVANVSLMGVGACAAVRLGAAVAYAEYDACWCVVGVGCEMLGAYASMRTWLDERALGFNSSVFDPEAVFAAQACQWRTRSDAAQVLASYMRCHPRVAQVRYPGLKSDPTFAVAARTLTGGFGPLVDYQLVGEDDWHRLMCADEDARVQVMRMERALGDTP